MEELIKYLKEYKAYVNKENPRLNYKKVTLDGFLEWLANKEIKG